MSIQKYIPDRKNKSLVSITERIITALHWFLLEENSFVLRYPLFQHVHTRC